MGGGGWASAEMFYNLENYSLIFKEGRVTHPSILSLPLTHNSPFFSKTSPLFCSLFQPTVFCKGVGRVCLKRSHSFKADAEMISTNLGLLFLSSC